MLPIDPQTKIYVAGLAGVSFLSICLSYILTKPKKHDDNPGIAHALWLFVYGCFLKPHSGGGKGNQQDALESFYKTQAGAYDVTRGALLKGREDMLALAAAQLVYRAKQEAENKRRIWVDVSRDAAGHYFLPYLNSSDLTPGRSAVALVSTSKQWPSLSTSPTFSPASISSTSLPPSAK